MQTPVNASDYSRVDTPKRPLIRPLFVTLGVIAAVIIAGLFIWLFIWLARTQAPTIEAVRDIFLIVLALEFCLFGIVLVILLVMVIRLINMLEFEIKPILDKTNETVNTVRGTTLFMSENVVKPVTRARAQSAGIMRGLRVLFGNPKRNLED